jgi:hypothetical protein
MQKKSFRCLGAVFCKRHIPSDSKCFRCEEPKDLLSIHQKIYTHAHSNLPLCPMHYREYLVSVKCLPLQNDESLIDVSLDELRRLWNG